MVILKTIKRGELMLHVHSTYLCLKAIQRQQVFDMEQCVGTLSAYNRDSGFRVVEGESRKGRVDVSSKIRVKTSEIAKNYEYVCSLRWQASPSKPAAQVHDASLRSQLGRKTKIPGVTNRTNKQVLRKENARLAAGQSYHNVCCHLPQCFQRMKDRRCKKRAGA